MVKAREIYTQLPLDQSSDYDTVNAVGQCPQKQTEPPRNQNENPTEKAKITNKSKKTNPGPNRTSGHQKVQVGKDQEKAQSEKDSHSKNRGGKKPN